jgi:hypothetical protein
VRDQRRNTIVELDLLGHLSREAARSRRRVLSSPASSAPTITPVPEHAASFDRARSRGVPPMRKYWQRAPPARCRLDSATARTARFTGTTTTRPDPIAPGAARPIGQHGEPRRRQHRARGAFGPRDIARRRIPRCAGRTAVCLARTG